MGGWGSYASAGGRRGLRETEIIDNRVCDWRVHHVWCNANGRARPSFSFSNPFCSPQASQENETNILAETENFYLLTDGFIYQLKSDD